MNNKDFKKNSEINIIENIKVLRNELQEIYKSNNGYDYVLFKNKIKDSLNKNLILKSEEIDFYNFLITTRIAKKLKTIPSDINDYLEDRFDKSAICRFHFGLDRYNQEPVDEWDIKTIIKDIAILRFSDNENYNLKDFIRNDHLIDGILDFDVTSESVMRKITNKIRQEFNLPKIGEGWVNETNLFNKIKNIMNKYNVDVKFHYKPTFLRLQELDIYFEYKNKKIGIEYQGQQHYEPIKFFGGVEGFKKTQLRDNKKKDLCFKNNVNLIYFKYDESLDNNYIINKINNQLSLGLN